jgi:hypothetical protein
LLERLGPGLELGQQLPLELQQQLGLSVSQSL